jgi:aldehyde:ferredoxin oxidoreductase
MQRCQSWATSRRAKPASGWDVGAEILQALGRQTLRLEREFNRCAGFIAADDRLPEWMTREPLASHQAVFDGAESDLDAIFAEI